jgi:tripartite-type tricarboxylate transporter receptor subunit TctC
MKKVLVVLLVAAIAVSSAFAGGQQGASGGAAPAAKAAPSFPTKAMSLICPWTAGGGTDALCRALAAAAEKQLGKPVTVENKTGGGGTIGHVAIEQARPDGYTVGMITFELSTYKAQNMADVTYENYDPLMLLNQDACTVTVKADAPYKTLEEFIAYCKAHPGEMNFGNSAPGSVWHIGAALFAGAVGIDVKHVPFEGAAPAVTALAGGHIQAVTVSLAEVKSQVDAGNLRILAIMAPERAPNYPDVPTLVEKNINVSYGTWRGIALPKGVDPAIRQIVYDGFQKAWNDATFQEQANKLNLVLVYMDSQKFTAFLKQNLEDTTKVMGELGLL